MRGDLRDATSIVNVHNPARGDTTSQYLSILPHTSYILFNPPIIIETSILHRDLEYTIYNFFPKRSVNFVAVR